VLFVPYCPNRHNAHLTHIHTSTITMHKAHIYASGDLESSPKRLISAVMISLQHGRGGVGHVQGESPKANAAIFRRLSSSPVTAYAGGHSPPMRGFAPCAPISLLEGEMQFLNQEICRTERGGRRCAMRVQNVAHPNPKLRHSGQAQRRSGTHAVHSGEANWVQNMAPIPPPNVVGG
jgi:hypothetical protein